MNKGGSPRLFAAPESAKELWTQVLLDFPTECLPASIYPEHEDQPYVDITAVSNPLVDR